MFRGRVGVVFVAVLIVHCSTTSAFAASHGTGWWDPWPSDCAICHNENFPYGEKTGPHDNYTTGTNKCELCHTIHDATSSYKLLPAFTIQATCEMCHDGTGGGGVYGAIESRGLSVGASHRVETTNAIPGGDAATGGMRTESFTGSAGTLTCSDCHSPHNANTVEPFRGERIRFHADELNYGAPDKEWRTSKLLRQLPTGAETTVTVYGSDWCASCHRGRSSGGAVHNHPVDSDLTHTSPFYYDRVAVVISDTSLETTYGTMGLEGTSTPDLYWHNRGYVMPFPRTAEQSGHDPICQQCHEDARLVGEPGDVYRAEVYRYGNGATAGDPVGGEPASDTPLFQTFPHEGQNTNFLVETDDNLCLNCHPVTGLP